MPKKNLLFSAISIYIKEAPSDFRFITAKRIKPKSETPYFGFFIKDGLFYRTYLPDGLYRFTEFGGFSWRLGGVDVTYQFPTQGKQPWDPLIKVPGIYFIGSYKYVKKDKSLLDISYDLVRIKNPSEKELLQRLLKLAVHPSWKDKIEKRIKEIKS
ncbi:MAG: hypothetical protein RQ824_03580 [bacterium]|nr:hypothetical protein [bacterium]